MITKDNIKDIILNLSNKDKKRIKNTNKDYIVLILNIFNAGYFIDVICTNDYMRYEHEISNGNCILSSDDEIFNII